MYIHTYINIYVASYLSRNICISISPRKLLDMKWKNDII